MKILPEINIKNLLLAFQHVFAMFGATVLVPLITGLDVSTTLFCAGVGTLIFHFITKCKVPVFLGSSFAFLGGFAIVAPKLIDANGEATIPNIEKLPYACGGIVIAGLLYILISIFIKMYGTEKILQFFPPVVTGPIIISIGLILAPSAIENASKNWFLAMIALSVIICCNVFAKGILKIIPILLAIIISTTIAYFIGEIDFSTLSSANFLGTPLNQNAFAKFDISSILTIVPIAIASMMEHIGDIAAVSATTEKNYFEDPGLDKTLLGDGIATSFAGLIGGPANTTYGENTGVLAITKVYNPAILRLAAIFAIILSIIPKFDALINAIPIAIIGGISLILYGMISAIGIRNLVENKIDLSNSRNLIIVAVILVTSLGFSSINGITFNIFDINITLSGLAIASILGIILNIVLPKEKEKIN